MSDASNYAENEIAEWITGQGAPASVSAVHLKLHTGAPGEAGTANAATETTRVQATFGAASNGVVSLSASVTWANVSTTETITHLSAWDAATAGNHLFNLTLGSSVALTAGDDLEITAGTLTVA